MRFQIVILTDAAGKPRHIMVDLLTGDVGELTLDINSSYYAQGLQFSPLKIIKAQFQYLWPDPPDWVKRAIAPEPEEATKG